MSTTANLSAEQGQTRRLELKYESAQRNSKRHPLFSKNHNKWDNVCQKLAEKMGFYHHPFLPPPWDPNTTRDKSLQL